MHSTLCSVLALTSALTFAAEARAQSPVVTTQPAAATNPASVDPNIDRAFLLPTAMTQPAGSLTYNNYELLLHGITYGVTDRVQVSATVLAPIVDEIPFVGMAAVKGQVASSERLHLSLQGSLGYGRVFNVDASDGDASAFSVGAGVLGSLCLRDDCSSLLSASLTYQAMMVTGGTGHLLLYGASLVHGVGRHVKLLAEVVSAAGRDDNSGGFENAPGVLASYGVRFHSGNLAGDVGFMKPISTEGNGPFIMGPPFISLSYRWQ